MRARPSTSPRAQRWTPLVSAGVALALAAHLVLSSAPSGGLAPLAVAALVAASVGVPLARQEWRGRGPDLPEGARELQDVLSVLVVASLVAPFLHDHPWALVPAAGAWLLLPLARGRGPWPALATLGLATLVSLGGLRAAAPWTLLEPGWTTWSHWLPLALSTGLLLAGAGLGSWRSAPREPGAERLPWAVAALALLLGTLTLLGAGSAWESPPHSLGPWPVGVLLIATLAALLGLARQPTLGSGWTALAGAAATLWLAGPACGALDLWWGSLLPLGLALVFGSRAWRQTDPGRLLPALAAVVALVAAVLGWPGLPGPGASAAAAVVAVVAVWVLGGRRVLGGAT